MRRKEKKKIFDINNINKKTLNIIGVILSIIIIIIMDSNARSRKNEKR